MKFKRTIISKATVKKKKEYTFNLTEDDIKKGMEATYDAPYFVRPNDEVSWLGLSKNKNTGKLRIRMYHSYDVFEPI